MVIANWVEKKLNENLRKSREAFEAELRESRKKSYDEAYAEAFEQGRAYERGRKEGFEQGRAYERERIEAEINGKASDDPSHSENGRE